MPNAGRVNSLPRCRACNSTKLWSYFDLGAQPLANALRAPDDVTPEFTAPLAIQRCHTCGLSQLTHHVAPAQLYNNYVFRAGTTTSWHRHCQDLVRLIDNWYENSGLVVDIGANDGTLLHHFQAAGYRVLGVDPAGCADDDIPMHTALWNNDAAQIIEATEGEAMVVTAQNVFGHAANPVDFLAAIKRILAPNGTVVIEVPMVTSLVDNLAFDTIYHEHLYYWALTPLRLVARRVELDVVGVESLPHMHNGSMRIFLRHAGLKASDSVARWEAWEQTWGLPERKPYITFAARAQRALALLCEMLGTFAVQGKTVWAYGASAKLTVLLNALKVPHPVECVVDDTLAKQAMLMPGVAVPIIAPRSLRDVDVLLVGARNWLVDIREQAEALDFRGKFLIPLPQPELL